MENFERWEDKFDGYFSFLTFLPCLCQGQREDDNITSRVSMLKPVEAVWTGAQELLPLTSSPDPLPNSANWVHLKRVLCVPHEARDEHRVQQPGYLARSCAAQIPNPGWVTEDENYLTGKEWLVDRWCIPEERVSGNLAARLSGEARIGASRRRLWGLLLVCAGGCSASTLWKGKVEMEFGRRGGEDVWP